MAECLLRERNLPLDASLRRDRHGVRPERCIDAATVLATRLRGSKSHSLWMRSAAAKPCLVCFVLAVVGLSSFRNPLMAEDNGTEREGRAGLAAWQEEAIKRAGIMSRIKWTPVADGMPVRGKGCFEKGVEYTGVPYSSVKHEGRYIGFDIFLKTFLAAVQNPHSVVYTENLSGKVKNAACYYGKVCSSYTSYALGCAVWFRSLHHTPPYREGIVLVEPQSAQAASVGDIIYTPPQHGSHVEFVTEVTKGDGGRVTHVRVEDSWPPTTRNINRSAAGFNSHIRSRDRQLYRITNLDAWRGQNRAESLMFPSYREDSVEPVINRVLLLDRGDWVPYQKGQVVRFNPMDKDDQGIKTLVIERGKAVVEEINVLRKGVIERLFSICGDYRAYCVMADGSHSRACEFSICDLDFSFDAENVSVGRPMELRFTADNMKAAIVFLSVTASPLAYHGCVFVTEEDRRNGRTTIPGDLIRNEGQLQIWLIGENRYGRLKRRKDVLVKK